VRRAIVVAALAGGAGCGGLSTDLEGIYMITAWTENTAGCEAEGPSVLAGQSDAMFYVRAESFFGTDFVNVVLCADPQDCTTLASGETILFDGWAFDEGGDGDGWRGAEALVSTNGGNECSGSVSDDTMRSPVDGTVRIESRVRNTRTFAPDADGFCLSEDAIAAAAGEPCARFEVVTATRTAELP
jgi:hypothetical protein